MGEENKMCPFTKYECLAKKCRWWSIWTDEVGDTHEACVVHEIAERLFEIGDGLFDVKEVLKER